MNLGLSDKDSPQGVATQQNLEAANELLGTQTDESRRKESNLVLRDWAGWLHALAHWHTMITLTFKRTTSKGHTVNTHQIESSLRHFFRLINCYLFGKRLVKKGWTIATAATVDFGRWGDHPHAHLLVSKPTGLGEDEFVEIVEKASRRTRLIDRQRHLSKYRDIGGAKYLVEHGIDRMVMSLVTVSYHPKKT